MSDVSSFAPPSPVAWSPRFDQDRAAGVVSSLLTPILGRDDEIERILRMLDGDDLRVLTLTGPGGVGKTRLAREVMLHASDDFAHGAWLVPLAAVRDHALVPFAVAQSLGIQESGSLGKPVDCGHQFGDPVVVAATIDT
jgi:hypothetical protein